MRAARAHEEFATDRMILMSHRLRARSLAQRGANLDPLGQEVADRATAVPQQSRQRSTTLSTSCNRTSRRLRSEENG